MSDRDPVRVLVVEDDPEYSFIVAALLTHEGYTPLTAPDGVSALRRAAEEQPDLVMLDLQLPLLNGDDVLQQLRVRHPELPVVVVSGAYDARSRAQKLGATAVLTKPLDFDAFFATLARISADAGMGRNTM